MPKNFYQSESWKIEFHCRHQNYVPFESVCSTAFKTDLGLKIAYVVLEKFWVKNRKFRKNDDFMRKKNSHKLWSAYAILSLCFFIDFDPIRCQNFLLMFRNIV